MGSGRRNVLHMLERAGHNRHYHEPEHQGHVVVQEMGLSYLSCLATERWRLGPESNQGHAECKIQ
jgi:hypothetical protein